MARLFALAQNFPQPIAKALGAYQPYAELAPVAQIDARMSELEDWQLLLALHHHERPWDGLVTTDSSMLNQARELATLLRTRLTLVVAMEAGHNPVRASGLVFAHLENVAKRTDARVAQVFTLRAANRPAEHPGRITRPSSPSARVAGPVSCTPRRCPTTPSSRGTLLRIAVGRQAGTRSSRRAAAR